MRNPFKPVPNINVLDEVGRDPLRTIDSVLERRIDRRVEEIGDIGREAVRADVLLEYAHELGEARQRIQQVLSKPS